ncbi:MAG: TetR/AcrR family transcriptional regulator [Friedmanniella sp.]|nr:TetR/AcrR family transcriptional regulator [Friedmanniella sp.]
MTLSRLRPRRADVRDQLLVAAGRAFAEHGYADVSVTDIARAAGFTKGAVYSNFGGKPELFAAVLSESFTELVGTALAEALTAVGQGAGGAGPAALAAASLTRVVLRLERWPSLLAEFRTLAAKDPELRAVYGALLTRRRQELERRLLTLDGVRLAPGVDAGVAATLLLTCLSTLALEHAASPETTPAPVIEAQLAHVLCGLIR